MQEKNQLSYLFISHDLTLVYSICHPVVVMKDGEIIEQGSREQIFYSPESDYTKMLLSLLDKPPRKVSKTPIHGEKIENDDQSDDNKTASTEVSAVNWADAWLMRKQ